MSRICACGSISLPSIERSTCKFNMKQMQIFAFVDMLEANIPAFTLTTAAEKATWTGYMAGASPKVVISPLLFNPEFTPGEDNTIGGDNSTPDCAKVSVGSAKPTAVSCELHGITATQKTSLDTLNCMSGLTRLGMFMFNNAGEVFGKLSGTANLAPIPVSYFFVQSRKVGGAAADDVNSMNIELADGWDDAIKGVTLTGWRGADLITATLS
jgi:hypothetical protein